MSRKKRLTAAALCAVLALSLCVPAAGADNAPSKDSTVYAGKITGIIRDGEGAVSRLTITSEAGGAYYTLLISPSTVWVDAAARKADGGEELKEGERIYAFCAARPAGASGENGDLLSTRVVLRRAAEDGEDMDLPLYAVVSAFAPEGGEGVWRITVDQGSLRIFADGETVFTDYATGESLPVSTVEVGDRILIWIGAVLTTNPARTGAACLIRLPKAEEGVSAEGAALSLKLGENDSDIIGRYEQGTAMVPVAAVAKALGLDTSYRKGEEGRVVTVESETFAVMLFIDQGLISGATRIEGALGATGPLNYGRSAYIELPGTTWAPAELFRMLGQSVTLEGNLLTIRPM